MRFRPLTVIDCRGRQSFGYVLERLPVSTHMFNAVRDSASSMASITVIRACAVHARQLRTRPAWQLPGGKQGDVCRRVHLLFMHHSAPAWPQVCLPRLCRQRPSRALPRRRQRRAQRTRGTPRWRRPSSCLRRCRPSPALLSPAARAQSHARQMRSQQLLVLQQDQALLYNPSRMWDSPVVAQLVML